MQVSEWWNRVNKFPYEIDLAIKGLNNEIRQKILLSLNEAESLSFSKLNDIIKANKALVASHLKVLTKTLLVEHFFEHEIGNEHFSYYRVSSFGKALLNNLMGTLIPQQIKFSQKYCLGFKTKATNVVSSIEFKPNVKNMMVDASSGAIVQKTITVLNQV